MSLCNPYKQRKPANHTQQHQNRKGWARGHPLPCQHTDDAPSWWHHRWTAVRPVLTAISQSNGNGRTSTPHRIKTP